MSIIGSITHDASSYVTRIFASSKPAASMKAGAAGELGSKETSAGSAAADTKPSVVATLSGSAPAAPTSASASTAKSFTEVTTDARAVLDANLAKMKGTGLKLGMGRNEGSQAAIDAAFQGLDRRSLYAIASNSGGLFSKDEQSYAQTVMGQQQVAAMGLKEGVLPDASVFLAGVRFLDSVSPEEKSSDNWRLNRAAVQYGYESLMARDHSGEKAENVDSGDPVVNFLVRAIHSKEGTWTSVHDGSYVYDLSQITLFKDGSYDVGLQTARGEQKARDTADTAMGNATARIDIML